MTKDFGTDRRTNLIGSFWMVTAMAIFAAEDAFIKIVAETLPIAQILVIFGLSGAFLFAGVTLVRGEGLFHLDVISCPMRFRVLFEIIGRLFYVLAITLTPLSSATVILQASPIVVVAGAAFIFREKVGLKRWVAIFVGLLGVIIIIRPGTDNFSFLSIFAILGMLGFACRDLASRAAPASISTSILGLYGFLAVVVAGMLFSVWEAIPFLVPDFKTSIYLVGAVLAGVTAYSCLMKAMRTGEVSAVTPFRYSRLLFGIGLGVLLFNEEISFPMLIGCSFIVVSGLFILWQGKQTARYKISQSR
ncbi:DMT family transporter [Neptuniibacter sp. 1_MG-2023]|uniref:DMT family transporter n=1 Tax=Neptuniibacter sp. 1_MG-2023 TaxID=3062662 RepID=UPI0026E492DA|nr:DMT family transporter [Neptuniibacter sp. 1_MG-2023]MDO6593750.1 DMT family transporter [Neptuniibacter sp. 1_MG-2023]